MSDLFDDFWKKTLGFWKARPIQERNFRKRIGLAPDKDLSRKAFEAMPKPDAVEWQASSDTPQTDALADEIYASGIRVSEIRMLQHARKMERERNKAILALMGAECLATAWVAYWTSSPAYGNGTQHPKHAALMKQIREAYPENVSDVPCAKYQTNEK